MLPFSQWKSQMQRLSEHLSRTMRRVQDAQKRAASLKDKLEVEKRMKALRAGIQKEKS